MKRIGYVDYVEIQKYAYETADNIAIVVPGHKGLLHADTI